MVQLQEEIKVVVTQVLGGGKFDVQAVSDQKVSLNPTSTLILKPQRGTRTWRL